MLIIFQRDIRENVHAKSGTRDRSDDDFADAAAFCFTSSFDGQADRKRGAAGRSRTAVASTRRGAPSGALELLERPQQLGRQLPAEPRMNWVYAAILVVIMKIVFGLIIVTNVRMQNLAFFFLIYGNTVASEKQLFYSFITVWLDGDFN